MCTFINEADRFPGNGAVGDNRACMGIQFLIQKVAIDVQRGNFCNGNDSIDTGLGRVHLSAHSLSIKTSFFKLKCIVSKFLVT